MENNKWQEDPKVVAYVMLWKFGPNKLSYNDIIVKLREFGYNTTKNSLESVISNWGVSGEYSSMLATTNNFEEICKIVNNSLGITKENTQIIAPKIKTEALTKTLVISDLHCPFHRKDMVEYLIFKYGKKGKKEDRVNKLVINADFFDCYGLSRFVTYNPIPLIEEFQTGIAVCKLLCENFPEVVFTKGNHEQRVFKHFVNKGIGIDKMFLVNYDWVKYVATLFPNITVAKNSIFDGHEIGHYYLLGKDCGIGHFEISGGGEVSLKAAHKVMNWAKDWGKYFTDLDNCKLYLQGHTHAVGKATIRGGLKTIGETGCLCQIQEYAVRPDAKYKPGVNAWWIVLQENGETLVNESNYILWDELNGENLYG